MEIKEVDGWIDELQFFLIVTSLSKSLMPILEEIDDIPKKFNIITEVVDEYWDVLWLNDFDHDFVKYAIVNTIKYQAVESERRFDLEPIMYGS